MKISTSLFLLFLWTHLLPAEEPALPKIPVVKTWDDLMALPPLVVESEKTGATNGKRETPSPVKIRVGLSQTTSELNGGVVLYCLVESSNEISFPYRRNSIGPLDVEIEKPGPAGPGMARDVESAQAMREGITLFWFYMKVIPLTKPGIYKIKVFARTATSKDSKGPAIVIAEVEAGKEVMQPWYPWEQLPKEASPSAQPDSEQDWVSNPEGGAALPKIEGMEGQAVPEKVDPKQTLPQLIPEIVESGCTVTSGNDQIQVTLKNKYDLYWSTDYFLARWWVNGKPATLSDKFIPSQLSRAEERLMTPSNQVLFNIKFLPERLGAREGDQIGLQLLFCPFRWEYPLEGLQQLMQARSDEGSTPRLPILSQLLPRADYIWQNGHLVPKP